MSEAIYIKSDAEIDAMRVAGRITAGARSIARQAIRDGISTK
jgi:methionine aminopeptidase